MESDSIDVVWEMISKCWLVIYWYWAKPQLCKEGRWFLTFPFQIAKNVIFFTVPLLVQTENIFWSKLSILNYFLIRLQSLSFKKIISSLDRLYLFADPN